VLLLIIVRSQRHKDKKDNVLPRCDLPIGFGQNVVRRRKTRIFQNISNQPSGTNNAIHISMLIANVPNCAGLSRSFCRPTNPRVVHRRRWERETRLSQRTRPPAKGAFIWKRGQGNLLRLSLFIWEKAARYSPTLRRRKTSACLRAFARGCARDQVEVELVRRKVRNDFYFPAPPKKKKITASHPQIIKRRLWRFSDVL